MKYLIISLMMITGTVEAHVLDFLPSGLAHELLHLQIIVLPVAFFVLSWMLFKRKDLLSNIFRNSKK